MAKCHALDILDIYMSWCGMKKKSNEKNQIKNAIQIFWYNVESQWKLTYKSLIKEMSWSIYRHVIS